MPATDMIERVARAIFDVSPFRETSGPYEAQSDEYRRLCRVYARAAIDAMRDPTFEMMEAMYNAMFADKWNATQAPMIGAGFEAAIDAALSEKESG